MIRLVVVVILVVLAVVVALLLRRRRPDPPSAPSYRAPSQLDRDDFARPDAPVLAVVFASTTCNTCPDVWALVHGRSEGDDLLVADRVDVQDRGDLHRRYRIDGVPTTVLADSQGVVAATFFGPITADQLDEAIATLK